MIIKVPIYLEVDSINPEALALLVETANKKFSIILRKEKIETFTYDDFEKKVKHSVKLKVITREKALDFLRTSK